MTGPHCRLKPGGYATSLCNNLMEASRPYRPGRNSKGLFRATTINTETLQDDGIRVKIFHDDNLAAGTVLNFCPFCGGALRDFGDDIDAGLLRSVWTSLGGSFYGPVTETASMPEARLLAVLRRSNILSIDL